MRAAFFVGTSLVVDLREDDDICVAHVACSFRFEFATTSGAEVVSDILFFGRACPARTHSAGGSAASGSRVFSD